MWARLREARRDGRRIVAVGTTSMRVLEHLARRTDGARASGQRAACSGETRLFIRPGFAVPHGRRAA